MAANPRLAFIISTQARPPLLLLLLLLFLLLVVMLLRIFNFMIAHECMCVWKYVGGLGKLEPAEMYSPGAFSAMWDGKIPSAAVAPPEGEREASNFQLGCIVSRFCLSCGWYVYT